MILRLTQNPFASSKGFCVSPKSVRCLLKPICRIWGNVVMESESRGEFVSKYISKQPDANGYVDYTDEENETWQILYSRQIKVIEQHACQDFFTGLDILGLNESAVPQLADVNKALGNATGWNVHPVSALISHVDFFKLLANRKFPAATFIRTREELDYVTEPDIFHELFGHCPLLANPVYADFMQAYGEYVLQAPEAEWPLLQRLYWFTVEFGLINEGGEIRAYGGGILSSPEETVYSVNNDEPERRPLDNGVNALRTPYRIDQLQMIYYVINNFEQLYNLVNSDLLEICKEAHKLGEFKPKFKIDGSPCEHIHFC